MRPNHPWWCITAVALCGAVWITAWAAGHRIAHENGLMENQQALCLAAAALLFGWAAGREPNRAQKLFCVSLMLFCLTFLLREIDVRGGRVAPSIEVLLAGKAKLIWPAVGWLWLLVVARRDVRALGQAFGRWLRTPAGRVMIVGGIFYGLTWPFDKEFFKLPKSQNMFLEELGDSMATLLILFSAVWTWRAAALPENDPPV